MTVPPARGTKPAAGRPAGPGRGTPTSEAGCSQRPRAAALTAMGAEPVDVLVIGAGSTGAAIARDAALRGFRTAVVDKGDLAVGTSSHSSRLIHGGIRYLEQYAFRPVRQASPQPRLPPSLPPPPGPPPP